MNLRRWRRQRALKKVKPGDGRPLPPYRYWQLLSRSLFSIEHAEPSGETHTYTVDVRFFDFDFDYKARLYRDDVQHAVATLPATFAVPGGVIEVAASTYGLKRVHLVLDSGEERQLRAGRRTAEYWRARLAQRRPRLSKWIGRAAIAVLVISLILVIPQAVEFVSGIPVVADRVGSFSSPVTLPSWLNGTVFVAGVIAGIERALTLRNHWLIDADTWWFA
jgi:hypothetical protein